MLCYNVTRCPMLPVKRVGTGCSSIGNGPSPNDDLKSECRTSRRRGHFIETCSGLRKRSGRKHRMERCFDLAWQSEVLASLSLRKTISSRKGLCSLPLRRNWGFTFVAVILRVEDPDRIARAAQDASSGINRAREPDPITVVTD